MNTSRKELKEHTADSRQAGDGLTELRINRGLSGLNENRKLM
jgi:hypothetical protein